MSGAGDLAISVRGLSKSYIISHNLQAATRLTEAIMNRVRHPFRRVEKETFWALQDVNFEIKHGEVVGFVGRNGAGKSTLFKILSRIVEPTTGVIDLYGRTGSLLEVGTGFHRELTGRENIFLNGSILGMSRKEIARNFDAIVDFAGVEQFIDTPVKRYSSGMYVRLAFAVAAHLSPEILIVDEVLAVGDADFQKKCLGKMSEVSKQGRTVLFVSHNMAAVQNLCTRALLLERGRVVMDGAVDAVVDRYLENFSQQDTFITDNVKRSGNGRARITNIEVRPAPAQTGGPIEIAVEVTRPESDKGNLKVELLVGFRHVKGFRVLQYDSRNVGSSFDIPRGRSQIVLRIPNLPLVPAPTYRLDLWMGSGQTAVDFLEECYVMSVTPGTLNGDNFVENRGYPVCQTAEWSFEAESVAAGMPGAT